MSPDVPGLGKVGWRRVAYVLGVAVLVLVVYSVVATAVPMLVGADHAYVVRSDSMAPAIPAGSVVYVDDVSPESIAAGDVITFETGPDDSTPRVTHRVVDVQADSPRQFQTQGDANDVPDSDPVPAGRVVGRVSLSLPLVGYLVTAAGTDVGLVGLVVLPAIALVVLEIRDLVRSTDGDGDSP